MPKMADTKDINNGNEKMANWTPERLAILPIMLDVVSRQRRQWPSGRTTAG